MKKLLAVLTLLFLSSCIWVDDLGEYWDKGTLDPVLAGTWVPAEAKAAGGEFRIFQDGKDYIYESPAEKSEGAVVRIRSVAAKHHRFMMIRKEHKGVVTAGLVRYVANQDTMKIYEPHTLNVTAWIQKHHPASAMAAAEKNKNKERQGFVMVPVLDDEALAILDALPDDDTHWKALVVRKQ